MLKVNVLVSNDTGMFVDTFDLYSSKQRRTFTSQAAIEFRRQEQTLKNDLGRLLLQLEELQDRHADQTLTPKDATPPMTEQEKDEAMRLLRDPHLLDRIVADFNIVGEASNKLVGYLAAGQSQAGSAAGDHNPVLPAAGKTTLMERRAVLRAARGRGQVFRHDRAEPLLHGRNQPQAQDTGHRGGRRSQRRPMPSNSCNPKANCGSPAPARKPAPAGSSRRSTGSKAR